MQNPNSDITIAVPIYVKVSKKNTFSINLNEYRNAHFHVLAKAKVVFAEMIAPVLTSIPPMKTTKLHFKLFFGSNRDVDTANVCSIVEKFFCDAMVSHGILEDDNKRFLLKTSADFGGVDTKNPRVEVTFYDYDLKPKEQPPMRLVLTKQEIAEIIINHFLPILAADGEKRGEFAIGTHDDGSLCGVLDILPFNSPHEQAAEAPPLVQSSNPPKGPRTPRTAFPVKPLTKQEPFADVGLHKLAKQPVEVNQSNVEVNENLITINTLDNIAPVTEEDEGDKADIFDMTPHQTAVEIENDAQDAAEAASHEDQAEDAGTKEETPAKPSLTLFPKGDQPKQVDSPAVSVKERHGLFKAQNQPKNDEPVKADSPKSSGPVAGLFSGLSKPKHVNPATGA